MRRQSAWSARLADVVSLSACRLDAARRSVPISGATGERRDPRCRARRFHPSLFNAGLTHFHNLEVSALEADGRGRVVSSPRAIVADQEEAVIEQGSEVPFQLATSSGATAVTFKKTTLSLRVRPQITPDGRNIMSLRVNKDPLTSPTLPPSAHRSTPSRSRRSCACRTAALWSSAASSPSRRKKIA
jgi:type II secretory pathway component GspD/PulD (secretin)